MWDSDFVGENGLAISNLAVEIQLINGLCIKVLIGHVINDYGCNVARY